MTPAFQHVRGNSKLTALVSGDKTKLRELGKRHGVDALFSYDDHDELLSSGEVDAVYIALPNHQHADFTIRAARAGIHVLCEKPMAVIEKEYASISRGRYGERINIYSESAGEAGKCAIAVAHANGDRALGRLRRARNMALGVYPPFLAAATSTEIGCRTWRS